MRSIQVPAPFLPDLADTQSAQLPDSSGTTAGSSYDVATTIVVPEYLGFDLFDVDVSVSRTGRVTVSAKYQVYDVFTLSWKTESVGVSFDLSAL